MERLFRELEILAEYLLVDLPAAATGLLSSVLPQSDAVSLITAGDSASAPRVAAMASELARIGVEPQKLKVTIVGRNGDGAGQDAPDAVGEIPVLAVIPHSAKECAEAETRGTPVVLAFPDTPIAQAFHKLADKLLAEKE
jgi:MinD-like ATPase involved in chromosome partitioning or flagellar assembly